MKNQPGELDITAIRGNAPTTTRGPEENSSDSDNSSDGDYELHSARPEVVAVSQSHSRRQTKKCCTRICTYEYLSILLAFIIFYALNGLYTWALIAAALANTDAALISYVVIWLVFVIVFFGVGIYVSTKKHHAALRQIAEMAEEDRRRREENIAKNAG